MKHDEFLSLSISLNLWKGIIYNYIIDLSLSNEFDALLVFIDRFTKMVHLISCNKTIDTPLFTRMFLDHIIRLYSISNSLASMIDYQLPSILKQTVKQNTWTRSSNNTFIFTVITSKTTGMTTYHSPNSPTITHINPPSNVPHFMLIIISIHNFILISNISML